MIEPGALAPMFPLGTVLIPGEVVPLHVFEPRYRAMTADVLGGPGTFGVVLIARGSEVGGGDERFSIGTLGRVVEAAAFPDGRYALLVKGEERFSVRSWESELPYPTAVIDPLALGGDDVGADLLDQAAGSLRRVRALLSELGASLLPWDGNLDPDTSEDRSWRLCALAPFGALDRQRILEINDVATRLEAIAAICDEIAEDATRLLAEGLSPTDD